MAQTEGPRASCPGLAGRYHQRKSCEIGGGGGLGLAGNGASIARPLRDEDDWSIAWTGCRCGLCDTLGTFLSSRSRRTFAWPLATDGRRHVHTQIDSAGLPVRHQTRRKGRPYTLVLTKTEELFAREKDARQQAVSDLAWLTSAWGDS